MPFAVTKRDFDKVFGKSKNITQEFRLRFERYLESRKESSPFSEIYIAMKKNENISAFTTMRIVSDEMTAAVIREQIPAVLLAAPDGRLGFIIRQDDENAVRDLAEEVLEEKSRITKFLSGHDFTTNYTFARDKSLVTINNLNEVQMQYMKHRLESSGIAEVGIDQMKDGTYRFLFKGKDVIEKKEKGLSAARIWLEMQIMLNGENKDIIAKRCEKQMEYDFVRANKFENIVNRFGTMYLVGDQREFMQITDKGFNFGRMSEVNGELAPVTERSVPSTAKDYEKLLYSYAGIMTEPFVAYSAAEAFQALKSNRTEMNEEQIGRDVGEKALTETIDSIASKHLSESFVINERDRWDAKLQTYLESASNALKCAAEHKEIDGITEEDRSDIAKTCLLYDISPSSYSGVIESLKNIELDTFNAVPEVGYDLDVLVKESERTQEKEENIEKNAEKKEPTADSIGIW